MNGEISTYPHSHHTLFSPFQIISLSNNTSSYHGTYTPSSALKALIFHTQSLSMACINSSVLACNYAVSGAGSSDVNAKLAMPSVATSVGVKAQKFNVIKAQQARTSDLNESKRVDGRRAALVCLAATVFATAASSSIANAGIIEDYLEKSQANKELNDKKRLATSGANFARAYTVQFGTCKFPENFTGCQDLAKQKKVPFLSEDLALECEGKDKFKCGSNVFWKW